MDKKINIKCSIIRVWSGILSLIIKSFLLCFYRYRSMNVFNRSFNADWFSSVVLFGGWHILVDWCQKTKGVCFSGVLPTLKFPGPLNGTCSIWEFSYFCTTDLYFTNQHSFRELVRYFLFHHFFQYFFQYFLGTVQELLYIGG